MARLTDLMDPNEQSDKAFSRARRRAFLKRVGAYLRKDPASNQLLSFDEVRSALVASILRRSGRSVRLVTGGMADWNERGYPVEKQAAAPRR